MDWITIAQARKASKTRLGAARCSRDHWQQLATARLKDFKKLKSYPTGCKYCSLCRRYQYQAGNYINGLNCISCPLYIKTGLTCFASVSLYHQAADLLPDSWQALRSAVENITRKPAWLKKFQANAKKLWAVLDEIVGEMED